MTDFKEATFDGTFTTFKTRRASAAIRNTAFALGLELEIQIEKGWLRESGYFVVRGRTGDVALFRDWFSALEEALS